MLGRSREIQLHRMPLARAHPSYSARVSLKLFQYLRQSAEGAHVAAIFGSGQFETLRLPKLDDHRQTGMVHRVSPVRHQALPADHPGHGKATASRRRAPVSSGVSGQSVEEPRLMRAPSNAIRAERSEENRPAHTRNAPPDLLERDYSEGSRQIAARTSRKEQLVLPAVFARAIAKINSP